MTTFETPQFDDSPEDSEPLRPHERDMPSMDLIIDEEKYHLTWSNTLVKKFLIGNGTFDHFLHTPPEEPNIFVFFDQTEAGEAVKEFLENNNFPVQIGPILDKQTIVLYSQIHSNKIDSELHDIFPQP